jgi:RimJ/RimL family protein N-acetyltransferase
MVADADSLEEYESRNERIDCPVLVTERLVLRMPHREDVEALAALADNRRIAEMLAAMPHPYTPANAADFVRRAKAGEIGRCVYAMTLAESGHFIGCCGIGEGRNDPGPSLGYWVGEPHWGRGYATEAAHALIDLAFRATNADRLHAACRVANAASRRVIHKCGFQYSGMGMMDSLAAGRVTVERYGLDRRTWIGLRTWRPAR